MLAYSQRHVRHPQTLLREAHSIRLAFRETAPDREEGSPPKVRVLRRDLEMLEPQGIEYRRATPDKMSALRRATLTRITAQDLSCTSRIPGVGSFRLAMMIIAASRYRSFCANTASCADVRGMMAEGTMGCWSAQREDSILQKGDGSSRKISQSDSIPALDSRSQA